MRVVVIGAGVVGACVTLRLAQAGVDVVTLEAGLPASGTSGRSFAWLNAFRKTPREYFDLNFAGMREHAALAAELGGTWLHWDGNFAVARTEAEQAELRATVDRLRSWGYEAELLTPGDAVSLEPELRLTLDAAVAHTPAEGWAEVAPLIHACLHRAVRAHGASVRTGVEVIGFRQHGDRLAAAEIATAGGLEAVEADQFVVCAGIRSDEVLRLAGAELPLTRVPGFLAITAPVPTGLRHLCHLPGVHFRPDGGGRILLGTEIYAERQAAGASPAEIAEAVRREAAEVLPALELARIEALRFGVRPMPPDGVPMVGPVPGLANAYVAVSHSAVTLGALYGRLVATELTGGHAPELDPFRPDRRR